MNTYKVITEALVRRSYEIEAGSQEEVAEIFNPFTCCIEEDGSVYDRDGNKVAENDQGSYIEWHDPEIKELINQ